MGRFNATEIDNYGGSGKSTFFRLANDGDVERVRFMYNTAEDIVGYAIHEIEEDGKKRYVNCLRDYNEPKSKCPFCEAGNNQKAKLYIPLYIEDTGEVKLWERGKNYYKKLSSICARYSSGDTPLVSHIFEIERNGEAGDQHTTYEAYEVGCDKTKLEDLPEIPDVLGSIVLDKSEEEMRDYLDTGRFANNDNMRRSSGSNTDREQRRTPSRRRGEAF